VDCCARSPIRSVCRRSPLLLAAALCTAPAAAQDRPPAIDEALVGQLARLLQDADARRFDDALLRELLRSPDAGVRRQAALAAGRIGDPQALDLLAALLNDTTEAVAAAAAFALGLLREPGGVQPLVAAVRADARAGVQAEAAAAIARIGGEAAGAAVRQILQAGAGAPIATPATAAALLEAWRLGEHAPLEAVLSYVESQEVATRWRALFSVGRLRRAQGAPALFLALDDRDPAVQAVAVRGITRALVDSARLDPRSLSQRILPLLGQPDRDLRLGVLRILAMLRDSGTAPAIVPLLADADLGLVVQAETALGAVGGGAALAGLRPRVANANFAVRRQAVIAVAQAGRAADSADAALLAGLARDADWRWRSVAAEAWGAAGQRAPLEALAEDADGRVVAQALQALGQAVPAPDTSLAPLARRLLSHADPAVRSVAADLLARAAGASDVDALVSAYRGAAADPFSDARLSVVGALGAIARGSAAGRMAVANRFLAAVPRPDDYLVYRRGVEELVDARDAWGPPPPIATGRTEEHYRDVVRRWLGPALAGAPAPRITIDTDRGRLVVELLAADAPVTVAAFLDLVDRRYFDGHRWHRVVPGFVIQDGDPRGDGWGGPGFVLRDEVNPSRYGAGSMGMALSGPDTGGSQFFLTSGPQPHLDGTYPLFGRVVEGLALLSTVTQGDRIRAISR
jgi:cyclophilin family peptidyl-prolyl cis-trans isomerase/HEAT repeat protein